MHSTRDRFQAAIAGAPTSTVAAGVVTAMHLANMRELFQELEGLLRNLNFSSIEHQEYLDLKAEYTA